MSKLVRTLVLGAMLVAMNLAAATAGAQEQTATNAAVERFRASERASQEPTTRVDAAERFRAAERAAREHSTTDAGATPAEATLPARPGEPSWRPGLLLALSVLIAALAAVTATSATRRVRARQAA
jgi:hypothetical protein